MASIWMTLAIMFGQPGYGTGPDATARIVYNDLLTKTFAEDRPFTRYLSFATIPAKDSENWHRFKSFWINQLSRQKKVSFPVPVPNSNELVWKIDIRDYGWNTAAWRAVAIREPFHRQAWLVSSVPFVNAAGQTVQVPVAEGIRLLIGELEEVKAFHAIGVVRFDWFFRETAEALRSPAYYDLLYADRRFLLQSKDKSKDKDNTPVETNSKQFKKSSRALEGWYLAGGRKVLPEGCFYSP